MIKVIKVNSKKELKKFVNFPFALYKDCPYWVPPIIKQEKILFNPEKNPLFNQAKAQLFNAYKNNKVVGRIALIINEEETQNQKISKLRMGWFDFEDDFQISKALIEKAIEVCSKNQLTFIEGPMGFNNLDKVGLITEGYDVLGPMATWYNYPYYVHHYKKLGFVVEKRYQESTFRMENIDINTFSRITPIIKRKYGVKPLAFTKTKDIFPYINQMFDLLNNSYSELSSFVRASEEQVEYVKKKFIKFIKPEYVIFVMDSENKMIGFAITMPYIAHGLKKANGKLFPLGFKHILKAQKSTNKAVLYLIGVDEKYRNKGITALIFEAFYNNFMADNIEICYRTPELEDNIAIQKIWKNFSPEIFRKRCTYVRSIKD